MVSSPSQRTTSTSNLKTSHHFLACYSSTVGTYSDTPFLPDLQAVGLLCALRLPLLQAVGLRCVGLAVRLLHASRLPFLQAVGSHTTRLPLLQAVGLLRVGLAVGLLHFSRLSCRKAVGLLLGLRKLGTAQRKLLHASRPPLLEVANRAELGSFLCCQHSIVLASVLPWTQSFSSTPSSCCTLITTAALQHSQLDVNVLDISLMLASLP